MSGRVCTAAAIAALVVAAGCGSDEAEPAADTAYATAIASVDADAAAASFEWVDRARLADITGLEPDKLADPTVKAFPSDGIEGRFSTLAAFATEPLFNVGGQGDQVFGFAPFSTPSSVSVGVPPDAATRFDGVDPDPVRSRAADLGYDAGSSDDEFEIGQPGEPILGGPLADYALTGVNRLKLGDDSVAFAGTDEALSAVDSDDGSTSAFDDPAGEALASCVGDSVAVLQSSEGLAAETDLESFAIAIPAFDDPEAPVPERICAVTADADSASELADQLKTAFGSDGIDPVTNVPFSDELGPVEVETSESGGHGVVSLTATPGTDRQVGFLRKMYEVGALNAAFGGDPVIPSAP
jgi:hypothetical protein